MTTPQDPFTAPSGRSGAGAADQNASPPAGAADADQSPPAQPPASGYQGYGSFGAPAAGPVVRRNGLGVAALVVGILAILGVITVFLGILLGLVALILGMVGRSRAKRGEATNGGQALTGAVLGAVALVLSIVFIAIGVSLFTKNGGGTYIDCLNKAGNDQAAVQKCQQEFANRVNGG